LKSLINFGGIAEWESWAETMESQDPEEAEEAEDGETGPAAEEDPMEEDVEIIIALSVSS
jgi:hypothetical protein